MGNRLGARYVKSMGTWYLQRWPTVAAVLAAACFWAFGERLSSAWQAAGWLLLGLAAAVVSRPVWAWLVGPVAYYDLVRTARQGRQSLTRFGYTFFILAIIYVVYSYFAGEIRRGSSVPDVARLSSAFFVAFMAMQFLAVFVFTPVYAASAVTEEKERRTLEFLLATDLGGREVVLGKLYARVISLALLILAGLPILSLLEFMGGISPDLVLAGYAAAGLTLLSLAGLSILCSVYARKSFQALLLTYVVAGGYLVLASLALGVSFVPSLAAWELWAGPPSVTVLDLVEWLNAGNLPVAFYKLSERVDRGEYLGDVLAELLAAYAAFHVLVFLVCTAWATARLRPVARRQLEGEGAARRGSWVRRPAVGRWPMVWKELYAESSFRLGWTGRLLVGLVVLASLVPLLPMWRDYQEAVAAAAAPLVPKSFQDSRDLVLNRMHRWVLTTANLVGYLLLLLVAVRAAGSVGSERARQTLDSLLTTPLSTTEILFGKAVGNVLCARWAWVWLGLVALAGLAVGALPVGGALAGCAAWVVYAAFLTAVGMWFSAVTASTLRATLYSTLIALGMIISPSMVYSVIFLITDVNWWQFNMDFGFLLLLSPPVTLGYLVRRNPVYFGHARPDQLAPVLVWAFLAGYALAALGLWWLTCRRFRRSVGRTAEDDKEREPGFRAVPAAESGS